MHSCCLCCFSQSSMRWCWTSSYPFCFRPFYRGHIISFRRKSCLLSTTWLPSTSAVSTDISFLISCTSWKGSAITRGPFSSLRFTRKLWVASTFGYSICGSDRNVKISIVLASFYSGDFKCSLLQMVADHFILTTVAICVHHHVLHEGTDWFNICWHSLRQFQKLTLSVTSMKIMEIVVTHRVLHWGGSQKVLSNHKGTLA